MNLKSSNSEENSYCLAKTAKEQKKRSQEFAENIIETIREPILVLNFDLKVQLTNSAFYRLFKLNEAEVKDQFLYTLKGNEWNIPGLRRLFEKIIALDIPFNDYLIEQNFTTIGYRIMLLNARIICSEGRLILLAIEDITERKLAERKIEKNELRFCSLIENSYDAVALFSLEGRFEYVSPAIERILGYTQTEFLQIENPLGLVHPKCKGQVTTDLNELLIEANIPKGGIYLIKHKDGNYRWIEVLSSNFLNDPNIKAIVSNFRDITERKQTEEALKYVAKQKEEIVAFLDSLLEHAPIGFAFFDAEHRYVKINEFLAQINGICLEDHLGHTVEELLPDLAKIVNPVIDQIFAEGKPVLNLEVTGKTPLEPNKVRHWLTSFYPVFNSQNRTQFVGIIVLEITERKRTEEALQRSQERLELAQKAGNIGTFEWWVQENKIIWTPELEILYGFPVGSFSGLYEDWTKTVHPSDLKLVEANLKRALEGGPAYNVEFRIILPNGCERWLMGKAQVYFDESQKPVRVVGVNIDITQRKELERQKDDFLAIVSHELKTPVTSVKTYAQVLQKKFQNDGDNLAADLLGRMDLQLNKLTSLITDLLDVTKIQAGKLQFNEGYFDFNELIDEVVEEVQRTITKHQIIKKLTQNHKIFGDRDRIGQVLINLLTNAIKYSPKATQVIVTSSIVDKKIKVCVQDFGIGIPKEKQERIFEQFYQVSGPNKETFPGLGLGLYISSEIIKRQNGRIWVESIKNEGSTFCFSLPI